MGDNLGKAFRNFRTTAAGIGGGVAVYGLGVGAGVPHTQEQWIDFIISVVLAILGILAKDGATGTPPASRAAGENP